VVSRRGPQDAWLSEIHVVSKAVRGHWPLEGSNPSPSPQNPFIQGRFLGCLDWMLLRRRCRSRHRCSHGKPRFSAEWFRLLHREGVDLGRPRRDRRSRRCWLATAGPFSSMATRRTAWARLTLPISHYPWVMRPLVSSVAGRGLYPRDSSSHRHGGIGRHPSPASRGRKPRIGCSIGQHLVPLATKLPPSSERKGEE